MTNFFNGKKILITGGASGIGYAIVSDLASLGCKILSVQRAIKPKSLKGLANTESIVLDLSDLNAVQKTCRNVIEKHKKLDFIVFNASCFINKKYNLFTIKELNECFNVNFFSSILICKNLGKHLNRGGGIVFVSSTAPRANHINSSIYSASRAAIESYAKVIAKELAPDIRVNVVAPGPTMTSLLLRSIKDGTTPKIEDLKRKIPLRRIAEPEDIANAVVFLLSEKAKHITGQILSVNGGSQM
jgi:NAD(P)-dependent dehydrogenase (short-subunit alcohol dehydrogenase family)